MTGGSTLLTALLYKTRRPEKKQSRAGLDRCITRSRRRQAG
jgi:hypothetical protein